MGVVETKAWRRCAERAWVLQSGYYDVDCQVRGGVGDRAVKVRREEVEA